MSTIKQKKAIRLLAENSRRSVGSAMVEAGYSPKTATRPKHLTESKGFLELAEKYLPDDLLLRKNLEGLEATKLTNSHTEPDREVPDFAVRHKYLETGFKVRGKLKDDAQQMFVPVQIIINEARDKDSNTTQEAVSGV